MEAPERIVAIEAYHNSRYDRLKQSNIDLVKEKDAEIERLKKERDLEKRHDVNTIIDTQNEASNLRANLAEAVELLEQVRNDADEMLFHHGQGAECCCLNPVTVYMKHHAEHIITIVDGGLNKLKQSTEGGE